MEKTETNREKCRGKKKEQARNRTRKDYAKVESNGAREKWKQAQASRRLTIAKNS
jgi:hypothetical protein